MHYGFIHFGEFSNFWRKHFVCYHLFNTWIFLANTAQNYAGS